MAASAGSASELSTISARQATTVLVSEALLSRSVPLFEQGLDGLGPHLLLALREGEELAADQLASVDVAYFSRDLYVAGAEPFFRAIEGAAGLRWLHVFHAGVNGARYQSLLERGVVLTNSSGTHAEPIAQTAMAALLWMARPMRRWQSAQQARRWDRLVAPEEPRDLRGQTLLIVGVGAIGRHVARIGQALGLRVVGVRRSPRGPEDTVDELHQPSALRELLPRADWLVLACPLTEETHRLIDREALALLPRRAHLLNVARGEVVDEAALVRALAADQIAGAYLDVFEEEPLAQDSPLWSMPNVLITPHNSAVSSGNDDRALEIFLGNLRRWHGDEPLVNRVEAIE